MSDTGLEPKLLVLKTKDAAGERRVIEEYVLDAVTRLPEHPFCDELSFSRLSPGQQTDEAAVWLVYTGDEDQFIEHERETWDQLVEEGILAGWEPSEHPVDQNSIENDEESEALMRRLRVLAARMSAAVFDEFETPPAAVDEYPEADTPSPSGWWILLHILTNHQGYSPEEEIAANMQNIKNHIHYAGEREGPDAVDEQVNALIQRLEDIREEAKTPRWELK